MGNILKHLGIIFGFTKRESSLIGKVLRKSLKTQIVRRVSAIFLIGLTSMLFMVDNFANTGGVITINASNERVSETINAETINTVQTPIKYTYESRGLSIIHAGVDLVAPTGTSVYPIMEGQVTYTGNDIFGYGNHIIVKHDHDYESIYGHLSEIKVKKGDKVNLTTLIGKSGSTGLSTGPHLHLEIHQGGKVVNPTEIVPNVK